MAGGHFRHQPTKQRAQQPRQQIHQPGLLGDAQETQPEGQGTEQQDHDLDRQPRHGEQALDQRGEHGRIAAQQPARQGRHRRNQKKAQPEAVEHVALQNYRCAR